MTAMCMGTFGTYQYMWSRHMQPETHPGGPMDPSNQQQPVWVTKRYIPTDLRVTAPVARHKPLAPDVRSLPTPDRSWVPDSAPSLRTFSREHEDQHMAVGQPSTRCEQWSTLKQMLPSKGRPDSHRPPNWGTGYSLPPSATTAPQKRFPHINSPMTRYVDDMHLTNRLFKLH